MHIAIIMDGNGRWAQRRGYPRWRGHLAGAKRVRTIVEAAPGLGIDVLTLYAFSSDNWQRPEAEVKKLFQLLKKYCRAEAPRLAENGVRLSAIGRRDRIPRSARIALESAERTTAGGDRLHLRLAIDYSSRSSMVNAVQRIVARAKSGEIAPWEVTADLFDETLCGGVAPPDLLIRTAGEQRLSDFLLWECAYAELYFESAYWPEFSAAHLREAVADFTRRERRFGRLDPAGDSLPAAG